MRTHLLALASAAAILVAAAASAAEKGRFAAVPADEAVSTHGPYEAGACDTCHERASAKDPGKALKVTNDLCFDCHDDFRGSAPVKLDKSKHPAGTVTCTKCHNPHNSKKRKLLL
jgi:predicted CXXCH cytochrome family protein